nr:hyaluronidase-like protein [Ceratonova shasta]
MLRLMFLIIALINWVYGVYNNKIKCVGDNIKINFNVFWNAPSKYCQNLYSVNVTDNVGFNTIENIKILANPDLELNSIYLTLFYENFGKYPFINSKNSSIVNGGIPQNTHVHFHLKKISLDIEHQIPDLNYKGNIILDWEKWRPIFEYNYGKAGKMLKRLSSKWFSEQNFDIPHIKKFMIERMSKLFFDQYSKIFFLETINAIRDLRPNAKIGFYSYPDCIEFDKNFNYCNNKMRRYNKKMYWLFEHLDLLVPSLYINYPLNDTISTQIKEKLLETINIKEEMFEKFNRRMNILPYTRFVYTKESENIINKKDTEFILRLLVQTGIDQVVLWGSTDDFKTSKIKCLKIKEY